MQSSKITTVIVRHVETWLTIIAFKSHAAEHRQDQGWIGAASGAPSAPLQPANPITSLPSAIALATSAIANRACKALLP